MNAIALLTRRPHPELIEFYAGFVQLGYDVYCVVDDNEYAPEKCQIKFIQIDDDVCKAGGYANFNPAVAKRSLCSAWDKALYYFCRINTSHHYVWFFEDDVFIPRCEIVSRLDKACDGVDVVSAEHEINKRGVAVGWAWWRSVPEKLLPEPWVHSLVCAVRLSRGLLTILNDFVQHSQRRLKLINIKSKIFRFDYFRFRANDRGRPRKFLFIEYIFHTLAAQNNLKIRAVKELSGIAWRRDWDVAEMSAEVLYHPIKDASLHGVYRRRLGRDGEVVR